MILANHLFLSMNKATITAAFLVASSLTKSPAPTPYPNADDFLDLLFGKSDFKFY